MSGDNNLVRAIALFDTLKAPMVLRTDLLDDTRELSTYMYAATGPQRYSRYGLDWTSKRCNNIKGVLFAESLSGPDASDFLGLCLQCVQSAA